MFKIDIVKSTLSADMFKVNIVKATSSVDIIQVLPRNQCEGIKKYIVGLIIKTSSSAELMAKEQLNFYISVISVCHIIYNLI